MDGPPHPVTGSIVVLTIAHVNHDTRDCRDENLRAWCQRCHLAYDAPLHARNAARTRRSSRAWRDLFEMGV
jgi:5-methylcytosine-specific restriction endonuclease McrA